MFLKNVPEECSRTSNNYGTTYYAIAFSYMYICEIYFLKVYIYETNKR